MIDVLNKCGAESIKKYKQILKSNNLAFITSSYGFCSTCIIQLEIQSAVLTEPVKIITTSKECIHPSKIGN